MKKIDIKFNVTSAYAAVALPLAFKELSGIDTHIETNLGVQQLKNVTFLRGGWLIGVTTIGNKWNFIWQDHRPLGHTMIGDYEQLCELLGVGSKTIKLNDTYSAEISSDRTEVKVGCQTFPKTKIKELYEACYK